MTTRRALLPRVERAAVVLLETCDFSLTDALAALTAAAEAYEGAIDAHRCAVCRGVHEAASTKATAFH